jgi:hypothetical protein
MMQVKVACKPTTTCTPRIQPIQHCQPLQQLVDDERDDETPSHPTLVRAVEHECDDEIEARRMTTTLPTSRPGL